MIIGNIRKPPVNSTWPVYRYVRVDRVSPLGNPFKVGQAGDRDLVIEMYREYLPDAYHNVLAVRDAVDQLVEYETHSERETVLLCWCHPKACHASVIIDFVNNKLSELGNL